MTWAAGPQRPLTNVKPLSLALLLLAGILLPASAQRPSPIKWTLTPAQAEVAPGGQVLLTLKATPDEGYHLYSLSTPAGGPIPTKITVAEQPAVQAVRTYQPPAQRKFDPSFGIDTETFEGVTDFLLLATLAPNAAPGPVEITAQVRYQACTDKLCLPPVRKTAAATVTVKSGVTAANSTIPPNYREYVAGAAPASASTQAAASSAAPASPAETGLGRFLLVAFGFGLAAIFTPCVFPMIPITMSFFLNQGSATRRQAVTQAAVFCLGVIVLFTLLGVLLTAIAGPFGVVRLSANPWVNLAIGAIIILFGLSLLGAFEITLPSGMLTKLNQSSQRGGYAGTLLMGLTFSLTSFACVGPFVGTLLAASVQGKGTQPVFGMLSFAAGLASPFFLLALFPSYLQRMPRSGGWLARVKVVMGFVVLAAALKYISNADQVWNWGLLTRERFLAAWFVLFLLPGIYLLGLLRLEGIKSDERLGLGRMLTAAVLLVFAVSLLPGMFGMPLGELDAIVPVAANGPALGRASGPTLTWRKDEYQQALTEAKRDGKLVLVTFTGVSCTNCHWMKANMFTRPAVAEAVQGMILMELYTDREDTTSLQNQDLQQRLFQTVAIPYYALLDGDGKVISSFANSTRDEAEFLAFLKKRPNAVG